MTQDEIIKMAKEAGGTTNEKIWAMYPAELEAFAKLVAAKEREACAKVCEEDAFVEQWKGLLEAAHRIRARNTQ